MYVPSANAVTDPNEIDAMLAAIRLGCLVTHDPAGLFASHLPFLYDARSRTLAGHLALANPHSERAIESDALVIFQGPDAYVSPNWYVSKAEHGRVVPTWNYQALHVQGRLTWRREPGWLFDHLTALTNRFERDQAEPWAIGDAPADYIARLAGAIIGLEIQIEQVEAKQKLSQNRSDADRQGVIAGLIRQDSNSDRRVAEAMRLSVRQAPPKATT